MKQYTFIISVLFEDLSFVSDSFLFLPSCFYETNILNADCFLFQVNLPLKLRASRVQEDCKLTAVPMPRTKCWDEEVETCFSLPQLVMREEYPSKCSVAASDDQCERVRLTIPRETCFHVEKKYPHKVTTTSKLKVA